MKKITRIVLIGAGLSLCGFTAYRYIGSTSESTHESSKSLVKELLAYADVEINGTRPWDIQVLDDAFYTRVIKDGSLGLGESYMQGQWDCQAIDECIYRIVRANIDQKAPFSLSTLWTVVQAKLFNLQDKQGCKKVIDAHYQLGNDLYRNMLDPTMAYSCAYWKDANNLESAQNAKYDLICRKLYLQPGMKVLDIGCGWGGFAHYAAKHYGVHVVGITLSENQAAYARNVCAGLPVEIRVQDYRDVNETFDRVLEIGMFEHVGVKNYQEFMNVVHRSLKNDGLFLLHTIGSNATVSGTDPWINRYIFPNGHLPSVEEISLCIPQDFVMEDWHNFGSYYDTTLVAWNNNFQRNWPELSKQYDEQFYRMWRYYLLSCAGSFRARSIQLWQVVFSKNGVPGGYISVR